MVANIPEILLKAISVGSVMFGAMTYIGNGPNFMVKAIAEENNIKMPSFFAYLRKTLLEEGQEPVALSPEELAAVRELADTKYRTWEWNYGYSPRFEISNKKYLDGGCLECMVKVEGSKISAIRFFGDFLATRPLDEVEDALKDVHYDKASVGEVLDRLPLGTYFGGISKEGILSTIFSEN